MALNDPGLPPEHLSEHEVIDEFGEKIGHVSDVVFDEDSQQPAWAAVNPGALRAEHLVPLEGAYLSAEGRLVLPYSKTLVKKSPKVAKDHVLTPELTADLRRHYGIAS
jgi:sporulation protein YlmC with PRC-barrel domain